MLTTLDALKEQLNIEPTDTSQDNFLTRVLKSATDAIKNYCNRNFEEYTMPDEPVYPEKQRLPYDIEDACILWAVYRYQLGGTMGVSSERIDGLGQKNYALQHIDGKMIPAPPAVLALINPYRYLGGPLEESNG